MNFVIRREKRTIKYWVGKEKKEKGQRNDRLTSEKGKEKGRKNYSSDVRDVVIIQ